MEILLKFAIVATLTVQQSSTNVKSEIIRDTLQSYF